jgi:hypothetical protein
MPANNKSGLSGTKLPGDSGEFKGVEESGSMSLSADGKTQGGINAGVSRKEQSPVETN